jgi:hypothetical protein
VAEEGAAAQQLAAPVRLRQHWLQDWIRTIRRQTTPQAIVAQARHRQPRQHRRRLPQVLRGVVAAQRRGRAAVARRFRPLVRRLKDAVVNT